MHLINREAKEHTRMNRKKSTINSLFDAKINIKIKVKADVRSTH